MKADFVNEMSIFFLVFCNCNRFMFEYIFRVNIHTDFLKTAVAKMNPVIAKLNSQQSLLVFSVT